MGDEIRNRALAALAMLRMHGSWTEMPPSSAGAFPSSYAASHPIAAEGKKRRNAIAQEREILFDNPSNIVAFRAKDPMRKRAVGPVSSQPRPTA